MVVPGPAAKGTGQGRLTAVGVFVFVESLGRTIEVKGARLSTYVWQADARPAVKLFGPPNLGGLPVQDPPTLPPLSASIAGVTIIDPSPLAREIHLID